ncbi:MAG: orotate phosphoribosyltransferase [Bacteroidales bacterium]|nr:orotate phosphoribosyltransferase [Bacteroidales bacterium]MBN2818213.1 orotate phosphoribosyltransferase [Bacteroidales bacterium]
MKEREKKIAQLLLQINAIKLSPANPFTWASGWKSPIYCDNRKTLSYPEVRQAIRDEMCNIINEKYPNAEGIAGVATGAIAIGIMVAEKLGLPFIYIRSSAKGHGMGNQIEGEYSADKNYVVIEDLISTGGSSLKAVEALRDANCGVLGMVAIFTYGFQKAVDNFVADKVELTTLSNYNVLLEHALETGYIESDKLEILREWRTGPDTWMQDK